MYLTPQYSAVSEKDDGGNYFSYPQNRDRVVKNMKVCLPGGFSGSGTEFQMYKDNCMDLMADECSANWSGECALYQQNLHKNEQQLFDQYLQTRQAFHPYALGNSCTKKVSPVIPGQVEIQGVNPYIDQRTGTAFPLSCPMNVKENYRSEFTERQAYQYQQRVPEKENFTSLAPDFSKPYPPPPPDANPMPFMPTIVDPHEVKVQNQLNHGSLGLQYIPPPPQPNGSTPVPFMPTQVDEQVVQVQQSHYQGSQEYSPPPMGNETPMPFIPIEQGPSVQQHMVQPQVSQYIPPPPMGNETPMPFIPSDERPVIQPEQMNPHQLAQYMHELNQVQQSQFHQQPQQPQQPFSIEQFIPSIPPQPLSPIVDNAFLPESHSVFLPEQLKEERHVRFNIPSASPVSMFVTDERAINDLIYGTPDADCKAVTACSVSSVM